MTTTTQAQAQVALLEKIPALAYSLWESALTDPRFSSPSGDDYALFESPLYKALANPALLDNEKRRLVYSYLTLSGNAKCVRTHNPTQWRLRTSWQEPSEDALHQFINTNTVHTSNISTPLKENDAPMVTVTTVIDEKTQLLDYFTAHPEPLTAGEISSVLQVPSRTAQRIAADAAASGVLFRRYESREDHNVRVGRESNGTLAYLYHPSNPVPSRTRASQVTAAPRHSSTPVAASSRRSYGAITSAVQQALSSEFQTAVEIAQTAQVQPDQARSTLFYLEKRGQVVRETRQTSSPNMPYTYYRRAEPADAPASTVPATATAVPEPVAVVVQDVPTPEQPNPAQFFESYVASQVRAATASLEDENAALKATLASIRALLAR